MFSREFKSTPEWRFGVAYAMSSQYPTVYPTVDCAIFDKDDFKRVYLARKKNEELYRFVGGFASPSDHSFEESALREAREETCLECSNVEYVCSMRVDDYRYRNEASKVVTHLFTMVKSSGRAKASDDICELKLFDVGSITGGMVQSEHRPLLEKLQEHLKGKASA